MVLGDFKIAGCATPATHTELQSLTELMILHYKPG